MESGTKCVPSCKSCVDRAIQTVIKDQFSECTVLIIAHRIHTILDCNRILVMDRGSIAEFDSPGTLLTNSNSMFYSLVHSRNKS